MESTTEKELNNSNITPENISIEAEVQPQTLPETKINTVEEPKAQIEEQKTEVPTPLGIEPPKIPTETKTKSTGFLQFLTSKGGIILISLIATILVAIAVTVIIVIAKSNDDDSTTTNVPKEDNTLFNIEKKTPTIGTKTSSTSTSTNSASSETTMYDYYSNMMSLTQNNFIQTISTTNVERDIPESTGYFNVSVQISYGGDNSEINDKYDDILEENNKLIASSTTYDEIGSDKKLYLNGEDTGYTLFKHIFSVGLYGGDISDDEIAVKKVMKINPVSSTNYITGLYAPPGELITVEISEEDLENIGGSVTFLIGHFIQNNGYSVNKASIGIKRVPNLGNTLVISKTTGYIGSFIGGPIYISNPSKKKPFTITISGAVPYKHIIFGTTTKEDFDSMENYTAPFFELDIRDSIRYSGQASIIDGLDYDNLIKDLVFWDKCLRTSRNIPSGSNLNLGIHFLFDPCINANGALALAYVGNNWCQVPPSFGMALNYETATKYGVWGHIHELNHHFQKFGFASTSNEVTNNVINLVEYILYTQISGLRNEFSNAALTKISGNHNYCNPEYSLNNLVNNPPSAADEIRFYDPILIAFGPYFFINVTQYGAGKAGVDLFYESLVKVLHYDFIYYIENILNLEISEDKKIELDDDSYPIFIPVSTIYQTGRYFTIDGVEYFSNTSLPYRIPRGGATKLDFENHLILPTGFSATIEEITSPKYGTLNKLSDKIYTYTPDDTEDLSGILNMSLILTNSNQSIISNVKLGLQFQVDNTNSIQTNYIFDSPIYTDLTLAKENNFEGYSDTAFFANFAGSVTGIKNGNAVVWEGKFRIDAEGYKYIVYRGGTGPSELYAKINDETEYTRIGYIVKNQAQYMFAYPSYAYYERELNIGDIITFKAYLLSTSASANLYIGISKEAEHSKVRTLGSSDIVGVNSEFDTPYEFNSGDPFYTEKQFDSLSFFDYSLVTLTSPDFESWDGTETYGLSKLIDRNSNTYLHTKKGKKITESNPCTLDFDLGREYYFDYIYFIRKSPNNYYPSIVSIYTSSDYTNWELKEENINTVLNNNLIEINLAEKLHTRYVRIAITGTATPTVGYLALISIEFIEKNVAYAQKRPEYALIKYPEGKTVTINYDNFPYFGHSYVLQSGSYMTFSIENTTGVRIKTCNKYATEVSYNVKKDGEIIKEGSITIVEDDDTDFPVVITGLDKGNYDFQFNIVDGSFDFDYILYEI